MTAEPRGEMASGRANRGQLRASQADREQVIDVLKTAFVQGRLAKHELDARVGQAFVSRTYAELAVITADLPTGLVGTQPPRKSAPAKAQPQKTTDINPAVVALITGMSALTAGLWAVLIGHKINDDGAKMMVLFLLILTFTDIGMLILAGVVIRESHHQKHSGHQLPPSAPTARGQTSRRQVPGASAQQLPQANPGRQLTAEAQRSVPPGGNRSARGNRSLGAVSAAS